MKINSDSAQMILITGFTIGIAVVVSTVMLNNIIYASNMASESSIDNSRFETSNMVKMTNEAVEDAYNTSKILNNGTFDEQDFNDYMESYNDAVADMFVFSGASISCSLENRGSSYFTEDGKYTGTADWVPQYSIDTTNTFLVEIADRSYLENTKPSDRVKIQAVNNSTLAEIWGLTIIDLGGDINFKITDSTNGSIVIEERTLTAGKEVSFDIIGNSFEWVDDFGNQYSEPLDFQFNTVTAGTIYNFQIENGHKAFGSYTMSGTLNGGQPFEINNQGSEGDTYAVVDINSGTTNTELSIPAISGDELI